MHTHMCIRKVCVAKKMCDGDNLGGGDRRQEGRAPEGVARGDEISEEIPSFLTHAVGEMAQALESQITASPAPLTKKPINPHSTAPISFKLLRADYVVLPSNGSRASAHCSEVV